MLLGMRGILCWSAHSMIMFALSMLIYCSMLVFPCAFSCGTRTRRPCLILSLPSQMSLGHEHGFVLISLAGPMDIVNLSLSHITETARCVIDAFEQDAGLLTEFHADHAYMIPTSVSNHHRTMNWMLDHLQLLIFHYPAGRIAPRLPPKKVQCQPGKHLSSNMNQKEGPCPPNTSTRPSQQSGDSA